MTAPHQHLLQTPAWGELKRAFGWAPQTITTPAGTALVLFRALPLGLTLAYVPRGPALSWSQPDKLAQLFHDIETVCRARRAICLKWEPDWPDTHAARDTVLALGFQPSPQTVQPQRTSVIDLAGSEADILARMKQKTRYNINLARKKEIVVRAAQAVDDVDTFNTLMHTTGARDGFGVHDPAYYRRAYELFHPLGQCELFLAYYQQQPLAGVMAFSLGARAWYLYGASSNAERNRMAPYLAQWEALRWAKTQGALSYDLWGIPDENEEVLETQFDIRHDGLWGVYRFKRGWGGALVRTLGAWDKVFNAPMYQAYVLYLQLRKQSLG